MKSLQALRFRTMHNISTLVVLPACEIAPGAIRYLVVVVAIMDLRERRYRCREDAV